MRTITGARPRALSPSQMQTAAGISKSMFVIHYYMDRSLVAIEGPVESAGAAQDYLDRRSHYLDFEPRVLSMNAPRMHASACAATRARLDNAGARSISPLSA